MIIKLHDNIFRDYPNAKATIYFNSIDNTNVTANLCADIKAIEDSLVYKIIHLSDMCDESKIEIGLGGKIKVFNINTNEELPLGDDYLISDFDKAALTDRLTFVCIILNKFGNNEKSIKYKTPTLEEANEIVAEMRKTKSQKKSIKQLTQSGFDQKIYCLTGQNKELSYKLLDYKRKREYEELYKTRIFTESIEEFSNSTVDDSKRNSIIKHIESFSDLSNKIAGDETEQNYGKIVEYFKCKENYKSIGENLKKFVYETAKLPEPDSIEDFKNDLAERFREYEKNNKKTQTSDMSIYEFPNRSFINGTTTSSFIDKKDTTRIDRKYSNRRILFIIAFLFKMTVEDTVQMFETIYKDRAYTFRDPEELMCYYCQKRSMTWFDAMYLTNKFYMSENLNETIEVAKKNHGVKNANIVEHSIHTIFDSTVENKEAVRIMKNAVDEMIAESEKQKDSETYPNNEKLEIFMQEYMYEFTIRNKAAREWKKKLVARAREYADYDDDSKYAGNSHPDLYNSILGIDNYEMKNSTAIDSRLLGRESALEGELWQNFPDRDTFGEQSKEIFGKKDKRGKCDVSEIEMARKAYNRISTDEIRKTIILLASYIDWYELSKEKWDERSTEEWVNVPASYRTRINDILQECGMQKLDYDNPYDGLFLFCSYQRNPLRTFRGVIIEASITDTQQ